MSPLKTPFPYRLPSEILGPMTFFWGKWFSPYHREWSQMSSSVLCVCVCVQGRATSEACTLMASLMPWRLRHWMGVTLNSVEFSHVTLISWEGGILSPQRISPVRKQILALRTRLWISSWGLSGTTAIPTPEKSKMFQYMLKGGLYRKCLVSSWHVINPLGQKGWYFLCAEEMSGSTLFSPPLPYMP